ncbi:MAG: hypothetical protein U0840_15255 [Gemmataceae bacterium]
MKPALARLVFVAALFLTWLGYLGFLVLTRPVTANGFPLVLSHPQILTSQVDIVGVVEDPEKEIVVEKVLWPEDAPLKEGDRIVVGQVGEAGPRTLAHGTNLRDYAGPGRYLLPLQVLAPGKYQVAPVPPSPGFSAILFRLYPATSEALAQYRTIKKPPVGQ